MSQEDIENAKRGTAALNEAYRTNDVERVRPFVEAFWDPEVLIVPIGIFPDAQVHRGWSGALEFVSQTKQEALEDLGMGPI
jgi:hypothetical protein